MSSRPKRDITRRGSIGAAAALAAAVILTGGLAACSDPTGGAGPGTVGDEPRQGSGSTKPLSLYLYQKPTTFNPTAPAAGANGLVMQMIFDNLAGVDDKHQLTPELAERWEVSPDATTFTFHLRPGLKWSDGEPFTSADVQFTYQLFADPDTGSAYSANFAGVKGIEDFQAGKADTVAGFSAPDDDTFVIEADKGNVGLVALIGGYHILPRHVLEKYAGADAPLKDFAKDPFFANPTVGMGPYRFVTYKTDQYVELEANENYRSKVAVPRVFLRPVTSDVASASLGTGEMDLAQISPTDLPTVEKMRDVEIASGTSPGFIRIALNLEEKRFQDKRVRQAMLHAIDRASIVEKVLAGKGTVQNSIFMGEAVPEGLNEYPYDPEKAKALLKEAGWDSSKPVVLEWIPGQRDRDSTATIVESQLNAVGVKLRLKQTQTVLEPGWQALLYGGGNYATDPYADRIIVSCKTFYPDGGGNLTHYCNEEVDRLIEEANATSDRAKRMELYQQAARIENDEVSHLWLFNPDGIWAYNTRLKGLKATGDFSNGFWNAADWSVQ
jgi:ABC-type transport system substrate-binding protein